MQKFLKPAWGVDCTVRIGQPDITDWLVVVLDDSDQADTLGYHTDDGGPEGFVFVKTAAEAGMPTSVVTSHELAELLVDPACNLAALDPEGRWVALECCDPVQGDTVMVDNLPLANAVTPAWFGEPYRLGSYDLAGKCRAAWEVRPGGYALVAESGDWTQVFGSQAQEGARRRGVEENPRRRPNRRRRKASQCNRRF